MMPLNSQSTKDFTHSKENSISPHPMNWAQLLESITEGFILIDPCNQWRGIYINREATRLLHLKNEDFIGQSIWEKNTVLSQEIIRSMLEQSWHDQVPLHFEDQIGFPPHSLPRTLEFHAYPTQNLLCVHLTDITARKQDAIAIERLAAFAQFNPNPFFELDEAGNLLYANQAAQTLVKKFQLTHLQALLPPNHFEIIRSLTRKETSQKTLEHTLHDHIFQWHFFPVREHHIIHAHGIDITERVTLEAHLRQVQKTESIGQLAGGIAHDFNNLLTVIQGYARHLELDTTLNETARQHAQEIIAIAQRATALTRQLLTYSRRQITQPKPLDLSATILRLIDLLHPLLGERITIAFREEDKIPLIYADENMIEQVIMNLCVNARDAMMPHGGTLTIALTHLQSKDSDQNKIQHPGPYVCLSISDTGCGMDAVTQSKIFEPFFTTKEVGKGTGLGLAVVDGIVRQHHGWIELTSAPGQGTTFRVYFPAHTASSNADSTEKKTPELIQKIPASLQGAGKRILIVEDQPNLRRLARLTLEKAGYSVLEAEHPAEARQVWAKERDTIDLIFTDIVMPGQQNGMEMAADMLKEKPNTSIIFCTGYSEDLLEGKTALLGHAGFLSKPYFPDALLKMVNKMLQKSPWP
jgi:signal transduction histidine kinase/ActR/RegA family two-component response regulator